MVFVLVLGDMHVPSRKADLPERFKKLLVPGKIQHVLCTGNLCSVSMVEYLQSVCPDVHVVKGDLDEQAFDEQKVVTIGQFKIGLCHGHQIVPWGEKEALAAVRRQLDVDILVTGHTHKYEATEHEGFLLLNPGSATGAHRFTSYSFTASTVWRFVHSLAPSCSTRTLRTPVMRVYSPVGYVFLLYSGLVATGEVTPGFMLMDVSGTKVTTYVYKLDAKGDVKVDKVEYPKGGTAK